MEAFLGTISQHAVNYAIRSGIAVTASFAIGQTTRLLKTVDNRSDYKQLQGLQERLDSKIRIISPAIDLIELISARGNTTLESAVDLTRSLRWEIQSLGVRLERVASAEEVSRRTTHKVKSQSNTHEFKVKEILQDIKQLLTRIEDAVPLLSLAITTSGVSLSTTLPPTVSPSRLLQASTYLTAGDGQFRMNSGLPTQIGPSFMLSLYMVFSSHTTREQDKDRETSWKEVIHKARLRIIRSSGIETKHNEESPVRSIEYDESIPLMPGQGIHDDFAYHLELVEDLDDDRFHDFEDTPLKPGPYEGVQLAGIREIMPIYQVDRIFYADTGKLLNIGADNCGNNPILLLKRDINAKSSRQMMRESEKSSTWAEYKEDQGTKADVDSEEEANEQIRRESSVAPSREDEFPTISKPEWKLPTNLDSEWLALEVYNEEPDWDSGTEEGDDPNNDSAYDSHRPSSGDNTMPRANSLTEGFERLNIASPSPSPGPVHDVSTQRQQNLMLPQLGPVRTSLSTLEMLLRLTSLQQLAQQSHLSIPDETLNFFLHESSSTGAGANSALRRDARRNAKVKVGFDPYNESPIKQRNAPYEEGGQGWASPRSESFFDGRDRDSRHSTPYIRGERWDQRDDTPQRQDSEPLPSSRRGGTPDQPWLLRTRENLAPDSLQSSVPSSPASPYQPTKKSKKSNAGPLQRLQRESVGNVKSSPLGRGMSVDTDSSLGTSPGSPTLVDRGERVS